jgi:hypothetical protein
MTEEEALLTEARRLRKEAYELVSALQEAAWSGDMAQYITLKLRNADLQWQAQTLEERVIVRRATQLPQR